MPRSPVEITSGRPRWKIRNISAVQRPMPLISISSAITSSSPSSGRRLQVQLPVANALGEVAEVGDLAPGEAGVAERLRVGVYHLLRRGHAVEQVLDAPPDRGRGLGRELLADDRAGERV